MQQFTHPNSGKGFRQRAAGKSGRVQRIRPWKEARSGMVCANCPDRHGTESHPENPVLKYDPVAARRADTPYRLACLIPSCSCRDWEPIPKRTGRAITAPPPRDIDTLTSDWESMRDALGFDPTEVLE